MSEKDRDGFPVGQPIVVNETPGRSRQNKKAARLLVPGGSFGTPIMPLFMRLDSGPVEEPDPNP